MSNDAIFILNSDFQVVKINATAEQLLDFTEEEIIEKHFVTLFKNSDQSLVHESLVRMLQGIRVSQEIIEFRKKDGNFFLGEWSGNADVHHQYIYIVARKVNEILLAHKAVPDIVVNFIKNAPSCVALFDRNMRYIVASDYWTGEYLKNIQEYTGKSHLDLFPNSPFASFYQRTLTGEVIKENDYYFTNKNGAKEWMAFEMRPWTDASGEIGGIVITSENITFRKVAHAAVTEKSQMLNGILRNLPVIIYRINNEGVFTQNIGAGLKIIGLSDNELVGKRAADFFSGFEDALVAFRNSSKSVFQSSGNRNNKEWSFENHIFHDNVNNNGIIGFAFDVTDSLLKEKALHLARERAETADKYKSRFLANMSHEIRTPLNAIIGFADVFERRNLTQEQKEHLHNITTSGNMLLKLIGDILDLSKIEEGKLNVEAESFNIKELLSSDLLPYKYNANKKGLDFHLHFDEKLPENVIGDSSKIKQIIINLIGNALKFTREGGVKVEVALENDPKEEQVNIRFSVADTGMGIPIEKQEQIFESFTQADSSIVKQYGGSGLGLSIVKQLVELMGGEINITSPSNKSDLGGFGSTFWFVLSLKIDTQKKKHHRKYKEEVKKFEKEINVLVAEDNPMNQALAEVILSRLNCKVTIAENGDEAVDAFLAGTFDLIFMDVQMPVLNGYQATELIRKKYSSTIPIIGLTANVYKEDVDKCISSGMDDYLGKPYTEVQIYQTLKKWVQQKEEEQVKCTNLEYLETSSDGNPDFVRNMVLVFLKQNEEFIINIEKALNGKDRDLLKKAAHKIKSCYKMVGITSAEELIQEIESETREKEEDWKQMSLLVEQIKKLSSRAEKELKNQFLMIEK